MFSLRIVNVDHYMSSPKSGLDLTYSQFRGAQVKSVPVFRIFGSTASGKKTCLHVHGVFPYILVPYSGGEDAGRLMYQLTSSLDKAINISQNTSHSSRQHVFKIVQVSGRPFYGYHSQDHQFLKIFFYNPLIVKKASDLLQNGAVCGTKFQIHEGHVPFTLQFFIDYNLYGMSFINLKSVVYRKDASPPGVTPGNLPKESCCELEADAVAIDILNRLTIEGELAVNPGLAAIWREEQQRLKRDDLDPSQRPLPLVAMSELLLREKLKGNLKYQGKCKTPLKEQIPYPAETQRTTGSDILDASVLNTHSISSLAFSRPNTAEETTIIDEELVWNLTQNSILSNSLDQSLVMALDNLAAQNEMNAAVTQNVEDDSILGSQILPEQDMFENDISDGELEALNYSLPLDLASDNQSEDDDIMEANKGLKEKIPQLDGIGDFGSVKKSKQNKRRRRVLVENAATESYPMSDGEEILISTDTVKDYDCWPESGKQETLEEIFSDEEPYNSPTNNFEDSCMSVDVGTINVDMIETVLRGDPSFVSGDLASEDVIFQSLDNNDDGSEKKKDQNIDNGKIVDKNSNVDSVPSLNTSLDTTDMLAVSCEELLNTSQLDEILNEDLNKGLEIICEKNPQQELKQDIRFEMLSSFNRSDEDNLSEKMLGTLAEYLHIVDVEDDDGLGGEVIKNLGNVGEDNIEAHPDSCEIKMEDTDLKSYVNNIFYDENQPQKDDKPSAVNDQDSLLKSPKENPSHKNSPPRISSKRSPQKSTRNKLCVKWIRRKKCQSVCNWPSFEMSRKEIQKYYSQLEIITNYRLHRNDVEETQPILWFPVRESINVENVGPNISKKSKAKASKTIVNRNTVFNYAQLKKKSKINCKSKDTALARFMNKCNISHSEKLKILSSIVKLKRLTGSEICMYSKNPIIQLSSLSKIKTETNNNTKQLSSGKKSSQNTSKSTKLFSQSGVNSKMQVSIQESAVSRKQKKSFKPADSTKESVKSKVLLVQENTPKISNTAVQKSDSSQKTPSKKSYKVFVDEQQNVEGSSVSNTIPKLYSMQKKIHSGNKKLNFSTYVQCDKVLMKDYKDMVTKLLLQGSETSTNGKDKEKRSNNNMDKPGNPLKAESITSCEDNIAVPRKDQSTNLKLDKKCVIKLIPLPVDFESQTKCVNPSTPKTFNRGEYSNDTRNIPKTQTSRLKIDTSLEQLHKENSYYPIVKVEQLVAPLIARKEFETINKATKSNTVSEKYSSSSEDKLKSLKQSSGGSRKRPLRIYSLDGAADNSSSDENLEEKEGNSKLQEILPLYCTPNKRRKSKSCRSPRNYVPLDIEIKKSPKAKPKNKIIEAVEHAVAGSSSEDSAQGVTLHERRSLYTQDSSQEKQASLNCHEKSEFLEPLVSIEILPSTLESRSNNNLTDNSLPSTSTSTVAVKPLKVFVKRLSVDTLGDSLEHERVSQLRRRFHRSSSLPTTSEEKTSYSNKIGHKSICRSKEVNLVESCNKDDQINATSTDRGTKVKKALVFLGKGEQSSHNTASTSVPRRIHISERKLSTDIFDTNSTPESPPVLSNHSESSSDFLRLSGFTKSSTPDHKEDVLISQSPLNNKMLSPDFSGCGSENTSFIDINRNPHRLHNPTLYTPALIPPSRSEVLAKLGEFGLPEVVNEEPFYSDPADVPKAMEVGSTLLKLQSKSVIHMEEFEGVFDSLSKWKKEVLNKKIGNTVYNSCPNASRSNRTLVITPLKPPPTRIQAKEWLKSKIVKKTLEVAEVKKITKITLPSSPGNSADDDDTMDDSMTISQCTPLSKASDASIVQTQETPEITVSRTSNISPLMASTPVNNQLKLSAAKRGFSRPSSGFRQSLPLIEEENHSNLEEGRYHHQDVLNLQTSLASDSAKQLSDSGVRRLLSESNSSASTSLQIDMVTPNNSGNYRMQLENLQDVKLVQEHQFLTILSMELHVHTRGVLRPNPQHDAICCVFYNITNDCPDPSISNITGAIYVSNDGKEEKMPQFQCEFRAVADEPSLIAAFVALVRKWDPDIFVGYETELMSWGYLLQRAYMLNLNLVAELSRVSRPLEGEKKEVGDEDSEIRLTGRIVLNLWRFLRHEVALQSYTFENMVYHILHQRVPLFSFRTLTSWWSHRTKLYRWLVFEHYITRVEGIAKLMRHVDLVGRTSEFARLFGIQFYEVLSRGSQFRVESMMLRLVKPLNYVAVSPSVQQRAKMRAPESLPLIMEPQSRFYTDPVIVLDFQSLYPSIIIAYNYCYSTCLGRVEYLGRSELFEFGCTQLRVPVSELVKLEGGLNFSPCGVAYVNQSVVRGVLPRMLQEILNTRLMVKQSMKENKENKTLQRVLHNRQLGLKLIANVTYGYTAANFSGRMPCIELGDSVVSKARETLERAINLVSNNKQWGAQVIYGDTDSMFVLVPGKSRQEAFRIGAEIAEAVTNDNPQPVKLKLEKVYQPCLLQTKKRYVGYMYESPSQEQPVYDAKGIETVRRDGCPAVAKMLEKSLRLLFETKDVSLVKRYVCRQFTKVLSGKISVQDLTFAREYRGAAGYRPGACVPALELAKQGCAVDPRSEPRVGERVPYVVVAGAPGLPLIRLVRPPSALLQDPGLRVNAEYYITRVIAPPINRCLSLLGAQVLTWYSELPRKQQLYLPNMEAARVAGRKATISQYFATCGCVLCGSMTTRGVCDQCLLRPQQLSVSLASQVLGWERRVALATKICQSCCGRMYETDCTSLDCPVLHRLYQARRDLKQADYIRSLQQEFLAF